jgi:rSAM/selenodomain-associated transferase 1
VQHTILGFRQTSSLCVMTNYNYRYPEGKIIIFAKEPVLGKVKTRLARGIGETAALQFHENMLRHTIAMVCEYRLAIVELHVSGNPNHPVFQSLSHEFDVSVHEQHGEDLGEKMFFALEQSLGNSNYSVLIGTDCPVMGVDYLSNALTALLRGQDAVIGPAEDGGYVLIGTRNIKKVWFSDVSWGSRKVLQQSLSKMQASGAKIEKLQTLWDVDKIEDLQRWQATM